MDNLKGEIIEESLQDKSVLKNIVIESTRVEEVTEGHKTPWLKQWTLHTISVSEAGAVELAETLSHALEPNYWYIDFKNDAVHYIIFPGRVFRVDRSKTDQYKPVVSYGLSLNIPRYQLDFSPDIKYWERDN